MVSLAWLTVCAAVTASPTTTLLTANASALTGAALAVVLAGAGAVLVGMAGVMAVLDGAGVVAGAGVIGVGVAGAVLAGAGVSLLASCLPQALSISRPLAARLHRRRGRADVFMGIFRLQQGGEWRHPWPPRRGTRCRGRKARPDRLKP